MGGKWEGTFEADKGHLGEFLVAWKVLDAYDSLGSNTQSINIVMEETSKTT